MYHCLSLGRQHTILDVVSVLTRAQSFYHDHAALDTRWFRFSKFFLDLRKLTVRTPYFLVEVLIKVIKVYFQWPVSRKAVLFHEFISAFTTARTIPVIEWNSTTIDNALVQGDNMLLNVFNNDLIPCEGFLSLNDLPTIVCCRQVLRLFVSTGLYRFWAFLCRHLRFSMSTFALFLSSSCVSFFSMSTSTGRQV